MKSIKIFLGIIPWLICPTFVMSQDNKYPLLHYEELSDTKPHDDLYKWNRINPAVQLYWGSTDVRYSKYNIPQDLKKKKLKIKSWKGEHISCQAVLWTKKDLHNVSVSLKELRCGKSIIPTKNIHPHFVRYVMTDELNKDRKSGCGNRENKAEWDSLLVADALDIIDRIDMQAYTTRPIWINIDIPHDIQHGTYSGSLIIKSDQTKQMALPIEIEVINKVLTKPSEWNFFLDLWQNPYAVARYYQVPLWSKAHFDAMRPIMKMLANAGQRVITASIMHKPWDGQTEDHYDSMVTKIKKIDGSWKYDYAVFDKWVNFMMSDIGIDSLISCYTIIPWNLSFDYYDEATNRVQFIKTKPHETSFSDYWLPFLKDFSAHLRKKGWFEKTSISMDERALNDMIEAIKVIKKADPDYKISLAGNYHKEIERDLYYLTIPYGNTLPDDIKSRRENNKQISCVYTCCVEPFPNIFTFSPPAEAAWTILHALAEGYDGFLRWAVNSWPNDPLRDSRFRTWAAGDTYCIYPGPRSSIRFEKLMEGLQACEKIHLLTKEYKKSGNTKKLIKLNELLSKFTIKGFIKSNQTTEEVLKELHSFLNS